MNIVKYSTQIIIGIAFTASSWVTLPFDYQTNKCLNLLATNSKYLWTGGRLVSQQTHSLYCCILPH